jgi:hypothetical protein
MRWIDATVVLHVTGAKPVTVYERWNSWGAYQWGWEARLPDGSAWRFLNPQSAWKKNFPSTVIIAANGELALRCRLINAEEQPPLESEKLQLFVSDRLGMEHLRRPGATLRAIFAAPVAAENNSSTFSTQDWAGQIASAWLPLVLASD